MMRTAAPGFALRSCGFGTCAAIVCLIAIAGCDQGTPTPPPDPAQEGAHYGLRKAAPTREHENQYAQDARRDMPSVDVAEGDDDARHPVGNETRPVSFAGIRTTMPTAWTQQQPQSPMHHASFRVPHANGEGDAAEIVVFFFGVGQGGPIDANIQRWIDQFRSPEGAPVDAEVRQFEAEGMPVTLVELEGEYRGVTDRWYTPNQGFITAIVDAPGDRRLFVRLLGDKETVDSNRVAFIAMVESMEPE